MYIVVHRTNYRCTLYYTSRLRSFTPSRNIRLSFVRSSIYIQFFFSFLDIRTYNLDIPHFRRTAHTDIYFLRNIYMWYRMLPTWSLRVTNRDSQKEGYNRSTFHLIYDGAKSCLQPTRKRLYSWGSLEMSMVWRTSSRSSNYRIFIK